MNTQKVLLGALLAQPDLAPYSLPDLDVENFAQMCNLSLLPYQDFGIQLARWMLCRSANGIQT